MPSLRERVADLFPGRVAVRRLNAATDAVLGFYQRRNLLGDDGSVREYDQQTMDNLIRHLNYVEISATVEDGVSPPESERRKAVDEGRTMYYSDVQARHAIRLWTNYGLGTDPQVIIKNDEDEGEIPVEVKPPSFVSGVGDAEEEDDGELSTADEVFKECWKARRNAPLFKRRRVGRMSDRVLTDGEIFLAAFFSTTGTNRAVRDEIGIDVVPKGGSTVRMLDSKQIVDLITDPQDADTVCYYKRQFMEGSRDRTVYYESWDSHKSGSTSRAKLPEGAEVEKNCFVMHAEHNTMGKRGWPVTCASAPWLRAYKKFMQDRVTIAASKAMFVRKFVTEGGSRAVEAVRSFFASDYQGGATQEKNPAAVAGSSLVMNRAVDMDDLPLNTGASDAQTDGSSIVTQGALGFSLFPHYFGHGEAFRLATTTAMETPILRTWGAYQQWWMDTLTDLAEMVIGIWEEVNNEELPAYTISVQIDPLVDVDIAKFAAAVAPLYQIGLVPKPNAMLLSLQALGVEHPQDIVDKNIDKNIVPPMPAAMAPGTDVPAPEAPAAEPPKVSQPAAQMELPAEITRELQTIGELARMMMDATTPDGLRQDAIRILAGLAGN